LFYSIVYTTSQRVPQGWTLDQFRLNWQKFNIKHLNQL